MKLALPDIKYASSQDAAVPFQADNEIGGEARLWEILTYFCLMKIFEIKLILQDMEMWLFARHFNLYE